MAEPPERPEDALRRLEERLSRASEAAERLIAQAAIRASAGGDADPPNDDSGNTVRPPPAGWQAPEEELRTEAPRLDVEFLAQIIQSLRDLIPPELQRRLVEALREVLLALRALIDWYIERLERRHTEPLEVQDIPIL
jgi:hypothetical protein